ncbi:MAG: PAS domain-containing protein [Actinomycetota bacterium]
MIFIPQKDNGLIPQVLTTILDQCVNGVTLSDPDLDDMPLIYANKAFEVMTGYSSDEILGRNCRFLQGEDRNQEGRFKVCEALENRQAVVVDLRNYRKTGELFYNRLSITPLVDREDAVIYFLGVQYDVTKQVQAESEVERLKSKLEALAVK